MSDSSSKGERSAAIEPTLTLRREVELFQRLLPGLLQTDLGKFALIHADQLLGLFPNRMTALRAGCDRLGKQTPFLVKAIQESEEPAEFTRELRWA